MKKDKYVCIYAFYWSIHSKYKSLILTQAIVPTYSENSFPKLQCQNSYCIVLYIRKQYLR